MYISWDLALNNCTTVRVEISIVYLHDFWILESHFAPCFLCGKDEMRGGANLERNLPGHVDMTTFWHFVSPSCLWPKRSTEVDIGGVWFGRPGIDAGINSGDTNLTGHALGSQEDSSKSLDTVL